MKSFKTRSYGMIKMVERGKNKGKLGNIHCIQTFQASHPKITRIRATPENRTLFNSSSNVGYQTFRSFFSPLFFFSCWLKKNCLNKELMSILFSKWLINQLKIARHRELIRIKTVKVLEMFPTSVCIYQVLINKGTPTFVQYFRNLIYFEIKISPLVSTSHTLISHAL